MIFSVNVLPRILRWQAVALPAAEALGVARGVGRMFPVFKNFGDGTLSVPWYGSWSLWAL